MHRSCEWKNKSFYGATKKEAMDKAIAFLYEVKQGTYCDNSKVTVAECVNEWFEKRIKMKREPLTVASYTGIIKNHINPNLGGIRVQSLQPGDIEDMAKTLTLFAFSPVYARASVLDSRGTRWTSKASALLLGSSSRRTARRAAHTSSKMRQKRKSSAQFT